MPLNLASLVQTGSKAFANRDQRKREEAERAQQRETAILQRSLLEAQIAKLNAPPVVPPESFGQPIETRSGDLVQVGPRSGTVRPLGIQAPERRDPNAVTPPKPPTITDAQRAAAGLGVSMASAHLGMRQIEQNNPQAIREVANFVRGSRTLGALPLVGGALDEAIRAGRAPALSPAARQLLAHLNSFVAAAAPERGGKQLTLAEMRLILDELLVDPGEDPGTTAVKINNRLKRIRESRVKSAGAWDDALQQFGITDDQLFGEPLPQTPQAVTPQTPGYVPRFWNPNVRRP